jgi:uncharacterized membrane protein YfcA
LITDPAFYAAAIPAVLLMGLAKSGFLSGLGAAATPLLALTVPVPQAGAIMLPLLMAMDATTLQQLWKERDTALLKLLMPAGLVGILLGALLFRSIPAPAVAGITGALTLLFLALRLANIPAKPGPDSHPAPNRLLGRILAIASGFTSFIVHAGGPPLSAYLLPLRLSPIQLTATTAVFFTGINLSKWLPYAWLGLLDTANLSTSLVLLPLTPIGVWVGVWMTRRIAPDWFYRIAYVGMAVSGGKLLWDGLRFA